MKKWSEILQWLAVLAVGVIVGTVSVRWARGIESRVYDLEQENGYLLERASPAPEITGGDNRLKPWERIPGRPKHND